MAEFWGGAGAEFGKKLLGWQKMGGGPRETKTRGTGRGSKKIEGAGAAKNNQHSGATFMSGHQSLLCNSYTS